MYTFNVTPNLAKNSNKIDTATLEANSDTMYTSETSKKSNKHRLQFEIWVGGDDNAKKQTETTQHIFGV